MENLTELNRRRWAVQLALTTGLALLFLAALLWGSRGVTPARADPGDLYVDGASGQDIPTCGTTIAPCQTISYTLNSRASDGDTILIATGTYTENLTITNITLTLRGGYAVSGTLWLTGTGETVINGNNADVVFRLQDSNTVLDGLTITGGSSEEAGGIHAGSTDVTIRNCLIRDNFASAGGAAVFGGGDIQLTILDTRIMNNEAIEGSSGVLLGGGGGHLTMVNVLVANNRNKEAVHLNTGADLMNVTIANNAVGTERPGVNHNPQAGELLVLVNTIIYGNGQGDAIHVPDENLIQATYSDIQGGWTGTGNIDADPMFVDPATGDYRLSLGSPAIDTGTNTGVPDHDLDQRPRPLDGDGDGAAVADMGAYEYNLYRIYLPLTLRNFGP